MAYTAATTQEGVAECCSAPDTLPRLPSDGIRRKGRKRASAPVGHASPQLPARGAVTLRRRAVSRSLSRLSQRLDHRLVLHEERDQHPATLAVVADVGGRRDLLHEHLCRAVPHDAIHCRRAPARGLEGPPGRTPIPIQPVLIRVGGCVRPGCPPPGDLVIALRAGRIIPIWESSPVASADFL